jgi:hypothetical protein
VIFVAIPSALREEEQTPLTKTSQIVAWWKEGVYAIDHGAEVYAKLSSNFLIFPASPNSLFSP